MAREVVTGYCWPQSVAPGEQVGVHLSSSGARPVRVEVARVGATRDVVFRSDAVPAEELALKRRKLKRAAKAEVHCLSAVAQQGLQPVLGMVLALVQERRTRAAA